jgi:hypothetical protein
VRLFASLRETFLRLCVRLFLRLGVFAQKLFSEKYENLSTESTVLPILFDAGHSGWPLVVKDLPERIRG